MAERRITAFNREYGFPHLQVFADRNRVEKEETFEIPSAARDRFLMELRIETPTDKQIRRELMLDSRFHSTDDLLEQVNPGVLNFRDLNQIGKLIQNEIQTTATLENYALDLWETTRRPQDFGIRLDHADIEQLILAGASARGMSMLMQAARVTAWFNGRAMIIPEDIQAVFYPTIAHRVFFNPSYELRRTFLIGEFMEKILQKVVAP